MFYAIPMTAILECGDLFKMFLLENTSKLKILLWELVIFHIVCYFLD